MRRKGLEEAENPVKSRQNLTFNVMSLTVGKETYSDKELADAYRLQLKAYNDWCLQEARKFFNAKNTGKHYKAEIFFIGCTCPAENQFYPDKDSFKIFHLAVKGCGTAWFKIFFEIFWICAFKK